MPIAVALFRMLQEMLANAERHAGARCIRVRLEMLSAIHLDRDAELDAEEVEDEPRERMLPTEAVSIELPATQSMP